MSLRSLATLFGFLFGTAALVLQFSITIPLRLSNGDDLFGAVVFFFSFLTILTNLMLVLIYLSELVDWPWLDWWRWPSTQGMMVGVMLLVMAFYHFLLAGTWAPEGWSKVADIALHYATPIIYTLWWLLFARHGNLAWRHLPVMAIPLFAYAIYTLIRGPIIGSYPYEVFNPGALNGSGQAVGYPGVVMNLAVLFVALLVLWALVILIDRALAGRVQKAAA